MQIFAMDWLLTGQFSLYGITTVALQGTDTMNQVFPKITKCKYFRYGPSGTQEMRDALCVLPLNILNEKLFLVLWFWLFFLAIMSLLALIYRTLVLLFPRARVYLLTAQARYIQFRQAELVVKRLTYGDFFVLYHVGKNVNPIVYKDLVISIYSALANSIRV